MPFFLASLEESWDLLLIKLLKSDASPLEPTAEISDQSDLLPAVVLAATMVRIFPLTIDRSGVIAFLSDI